MLVSHLRLLSITKIYKNGRMSHVAWIITRIPSSVCATIRLTLQRFKAALHYNIGTLCEKVGQFLDCSVMCALLLSMVFRAAGKPEDVEFSREVVAVINETVYNYVGELTCGMLCTW